jgi:hypothetical protein
VAESGHYLTNVQVPYSLKESFASIDSFYFCLVGACCFLDQSDKTPKAFRKSGGVKQIRNRKGIS